MFYNKNVIIFTTYGCSWKLLPRLDVLRECQQLHFSISIFFSKRFSHLGQRFVMFTGRPNKCSKSCDFILHGMFHCSHAQKIKCETVNKKNACSLIKFFCNLTLDCKSRRICGIVIYHFLTTSIQFELKCISLLLHNL